MRYFSEKASKGATEQTTTRAAKPLSQVAENVSIITAEEIERMQAHTTAEVLDRIPGIYMNTNGRDFGMTASMTIQASKYEDVLVLVDGMDWNFLAGGSANLNTIPVAIIKRIEIIKGPGSATWGSALGGVVNIITKDTGGGKSTGSLSSSLGERDTADSRFELSGVTEPVSYYVFGGKQRSDGLRNDRDFDNHMLFAKAALPTGSSLKLDLSSGYSEPHVNYGDLAGGGILAEEVDRAFWTKLNADALLSDTLTFYGSISTYDQKFALQLDEDGSYGPLGDLYQNTVYDEKKTGANGRLVWLHDRHTVVSGIDYLRGEVDGTLESGDFLVNYLHYPPVFRDFGGIDKTAVYVNDTILLGDFTVTPGLRHDRNSITESFTSPSLGITCQLNQTTLLRAVAARGFTLPSLGDTTLNGPYYDPNPDLKPEKVDSLQAGFETTAITYLWFKATYFEHRVEDAFRGIINPDTGNGIRINEDKQRRQGFELEAKTVPFYNLSLQADFSYVHLNNYGSYDNTSEYASNLALLYDSGTIAAGLYGHYIWYDAQVSDADDFIWDVTIRKRFALSASLAMDLFASGHNILNGTQESDRDNYPCVARWLEAGLRFHF
ncbi:MAG: TonB-dependent receptor [Thermodesulfobacteriota bacterium]